jgi:transcriptional regulator GlxA family with amidase domain
MAEEPIVRHPIKVHFLLLPDSLILDWAGPAEALRIANQALCARQMPHAFELHFVSPLSETISSVGARISALEPMPDLGGTAYPHWVVLLGQPGTTLDLSSPAHRQALHWLQGLRLEPGRVELVCICAGAVLAAHAGLLASRRATTHHQHLDELRHSAPRCEVIQNRVFVLDSPVFTSAGVTTGIDLTLHRIASVCGPALAAQVAQTLVVALRRGPHDPELSPFLQYRHHMHAAVHRVQDAVSQAPQDDWDLQRMAEVAHTSTRHLARLFAAHAAISPLDYLRRIRLAAATAGLQSGLNVTQAAAMAGFSSDTQMRRAWKDLGMAGRPSEFF